MIITKKESKQLRYFARANYKAYVKGSTAEDGGKVKHRDFPVFGLSYDEKKADKGMVEITNIQVLYRPFKGTTFAELIEALKNVLGSDDVGDKVMDVAEPVTQEAGVHPDDECTAIAPSPSVAERLKESETGKNFENMAAAVSELTHPEIRLVKSEIKDLSKDGTLTIDVQAVMSNPVDKVNVEIKPVGDHVEISPVAEIPAEPAPEADSVPDEPVDVAAMLNTPIKVYTDTRAPADSDVLIYPKPVEEPEKKTIVVTGPVCPERHDSGRDFSVEILEEAKQVAEETGKPVITAEQRPKKLSRGELNDLRIKCAVMKLAKSYGEPADMSIGEILLRYPNASMKLNDLYVADRIKPYTISEDAIREAYPDEYEAARKEVANV